MTLDQSDRKTVVLILAELSSELDLHYNEEDLPALADQRAALIAGAELVTRMGLEVPDECRHMLARFRKAGGDQ